MTDVYPKMWFTGGNQPEDGKRACPCSAGAHRLTDFPRALVVTFGALMIAVDLRGRLLAVALYFDRAGRGVPDIGAVELAGAP